jgi:hypothetical protein
LDAADIREPFVRNWLDLLSFLLSGLPANGTKCASSHHTQAAQLMVCGVCGCFCVQVLDGADIRDPFVRNWLDLLSFLLSGLPANGTIAAEVAFMFNE